MMKKMMLMLVITITFSRGDKDSVMVTANTVRGSVGYSSDDDHLYEDTRRRYFQSFAIIRMLAAT